MTMKTYMLEPLVQYMISTTSTLVMSSIVFVIPVDFKRAMSSAVLA